MLNAFIGKAYKIGSKFELTTASCIGNESAATVECETTLSKIFLPFFCQRNTCVFCLPPPKPILEAVLEILVTINISRSNSESGIS